MRIGDMQELANLWDECRVLNQVCVEGEIITKAAALVRKGKSCFLWLLHYDPARRNQIEQNEFERIVALFQQDPELEERITASELARITAIAVPFRTNRERIIRRDDIPVLSPRAVLCGDRKRKIGYCLHYWGAYLETQVSVRLTALLQAGWDPGELAEIDIADLNLVVAQVKGEYDRLPELSGPLTLLPSIQPYDDLVELDVTLPAGTKDFPPVEFPLPGGGTGWIVGTEWGDPWANLEAGFNDPGFWRTVGPEEAARRLREAEEDIDRDCPRGKSLLVIWYEAKGDRMLRFHTKQWLDAPPKCSDGRGPLNIALDREKKKGPNGLPLRCATLSWTPMVPSETKEVTLGMVLGTCRRRSYGPVTLR